ncbi:DMT family transporter [Pararhodobacter sp.]|jgi:drug/metabolite transporter (DMT)-like permease|uniref:DMT family transporter n=1 Tax=Pararhodobacter sp. TaxID=2127056 RepID=UPI002FDEA87E
MRPEQLVGDVRAEALKGHAAMLLFSASVAGSFSLGALVANDIAPAALNAGRFLITAVVLAALAMVIGGPGRRGYRRADFRAPWRYLLLGTLFAGYFVLMFEALKTASPVSVGAVFTLTPLLTAGFAWLFLRQLLNGWMALALAIGAAGAVWVIFDGDPGALAAFQLGYGEAIYFFGCVLHAAFTPLLRRLNRGEPALVITSLVMAAGFCVLLVYGWSDLRAIQWAALSPLIWFTLLYLALAANALTVLLLQFAGQRLPSSKVMAYTYLTPAWIILWELSLGHGVPGALVLPGIGLIALALVMLLRQD